MCRGSTYTKHRTAESSSVQTSLWLKAHVRLTDTVQPMFVRAWHGQLHSPTIGMMKPRDRVHHLVSLSLSLFLFDSLNLNDSQHCYCRNYWKKFPRMPSQVRTTAQKVGEKLDTRAAELTSYDIETWLKKANIGLMVRNQSQVLYRQCIVSFVLTCHSNIGTSCQRGV